MPTQFLGRNGMLYHIIHINYKSAIRWHKNFKHKPNYGLVVVFMLICEAFTALLAPMLLYVAGLE